MPVPQKLVVLRLHGILDLTFVDRVDVSTQLSYHCTLVSLTFNPILHGVKSILFHVGGGAYMPP